MDHESILKWCEDRIGMKHVKDDFSEKGTHFVQFENGETYKYSTVSCGEFTIVFVEINYKVVNITIKRHIGCGNYKLVSETTF